MKKNILLLLFVFVSTFVFSQLTVSISKQDASCYGLSNGCAVATASGGQAPYSYYWPLTSTISATMCLVAAGQYSVIVTDALTNTISAVVTITEPGQLTSYSSSISSCNNGCTGIANIIPFGGTAPYMYAWQNSINTTNTASNLCVGMTTYTITDANGCQETNSVMINPSQLSTIVTSTSSPCGNSCQASAMVTLSGGVYPYSYSWASPSANMGTTSVINNLCDGSYTVTVTDGYGCIATNIATITSPTASTISGLTTTITAFNETCIGTGDGSINVSIGGSNPGPFIYQWNNWQTTEDILNLNSGIYHLTIYDSGMNCLVLTDTVAATGLNCGFISGNVFMDNNGDCIKNSGDNNFQSALIIINPGNKYGYTNTNGDYIVNNLPFGTYTLSSNYASGNIITTCNTNIITSINSGTQNSQNNNFSIGFNTTTQPDMQISCWNQGIVPGFVCRMNYYLNNLNNVSAFGLFKVTLPSAFIPNITSASPATYTISGDTVIWNFSNVTYNNTSQFFYVDFTTPLSTPLGSIFTSCAYAQPTVTDFNPANNTYCYQRTVTGSFDPNDKSVSPVGDGATGEIPHIVTDLTYLIRFQNTGNGPAVNIMVLDTLSPNVDVSTFQMLSASHNYNVEILDGNILKWKFNNIMLIDSNANEPASHGYIQYRIKRAPDYTPGLQIKNTAYIYFDFNEPVVTNTALNTIAYIIGIKSSSSNNNEWAIYPNPSTGTLYIANTSSVSGEQTSIQVLNSIGQTVYEETITSNYKTIDLSKLNNGVYFVKIISEKQTTVKRIVLSK